MELSLFPHSTQSRFSSERRVTAGFSPVRHPRRGGSSVVLRVAIEDLEGQSPDDDKSFNSSNSSGAQVPKKRLEIVGSLLKERYGLGALLTAGFIKGLDLTADLMKKVPRKLTKGQRIASQRHGVLRQPPIRSQNPVPGQKIGEKVQSAISNTIGSPFTWNEKDVPNPENNDPHITSTLVDEQDLNDDPVEEKEPISDSVKQEEIQDSFLEASTIDSEKKKEKTEEPAIHVNSEKEVREDLEPPSFNPEFPQESNNIETFSKTCKPSTTPFGAEISPSVAVNRAKEILDEIANFELETGQSIDIETPQDVVQLPHKKQSTSTEESKQKLKKESRNRLHQMKKQNQVKRTKKKPVNVVRPSKDENLRLDSRPQTSLSNTGLKGLDYINSYAKESQRGNLYDSSLPISRESSRIQSMSVGSTSGSLQWNAMERLQRVHEIRGILQLGKGGGSRGGSGWGNGGGGGGEDSFNEDSNEDNSWIQIGLFLFTTTSLVFVLLTIIGNQLRKQDPALKKQPSN